MVKQEREAGVQCTPWDILFLRVIALLPPASSHIPGTEFFGVKTYEKLTGLSAVFIRDKMKKAGCVSATGGNKEILFLASDYARVLGGLAK